MKRKLQNIAYLLMAAILSSIVDKIEVFLSTIFDKNNIYLSNIIDNVK